MLAGYLLLAVGIAVVFTGIEARTRWHSFIVSIAISFLFAICIGPIVRYTMPRMAPWLWRRLSFPYNWAAVAATMAGQALIGNGAAVVVLILVGYLSASQFWPWYLASMRISVAVTLCVGLFITAHEVNAARLAQAAAQARLASLESRVAPHFLFNTLNSIAALTHEDPVGAERMTTQLAALLRSSLDGPHTPLVPLGDELGLVQDYLEIERVRFNHRLQFTIEADEPSKRVCVPRLAVQTLVENSVKYAVATRPAGGVIRVRAATDHGRLRVEVADDGPGFDPASPTPEGHGLALLRSRLETQFGGRALFRIASGPPETRVTFEVPV